MDVYEKVEDLMLKEWDSEIYWWIQNNYPDGIDIYADYRDAISPERVQTLLEQKYPLDAFYEWLDDVYSEYGEELLRNAYNEMWRSFDVPQKLEEEYHDHFVDTFREYCWYNAPQEHYEAQSFCCDILIDTGNWNYDCICDTYEGVNKYPAESSIVWLTKTQGYTKEQLQYALTNDKDCGTFLNSVKDELAEETSHMNVLAFFKKFTLGNLLSFAQAKAPLNIRKGTSCGLFDPFNGSGSILEIQLVEDITVPHKLIAEVLIDAANDGRNGSRYGIDCIYGMCEDFWEE